VSMVRISLRAQDQREKIEKILLYLREIHEGDSLLHVKSELIIETEITQHAFDRYMAYCIGKGWVKSESRSCLGPHRLYYLTPEGIMACEKIKQEELELDVI